ncbi:MAG TPA: DUF3016 domain-containing protein [Dyella sp.]|nr:DUF3016 domain-containing protein [Dyella sp.]
MKVRTALFTLLAAGGLASSPLLHAAEASPQAVTVTYDHPEHFTETREEKALAPTRASNDYLATLKTYIEKRGAKMLAPGQRLEVVVTDIDRAGSFEPWHGGQLREVRIIKDIYPPRIDLNFKLLDADGKVIREGSRKLRDPGFLTSNTAPTSDDSLRYEKRLIERWLRRGPDKL